MEQAATQRVNQSRKTFTTLEELAATGFSPNAAHTNESLQASSDYLQTQTETIKQLLEDAVSDLNNNVRDMVEELVVGARSINTTMTEANQNLVADTTDVRNAMMNFTEQLQKQLGDTV